MKYKLIYADPPWKYDMKYNSGAEKRYDVMNIDEIKSLPISNISDENCVLFIWATWPMMQECLDVIRAWGFTYKTLAFNWVKLSSTGKKLSFGLGRWTRGNCEPLLLATKGNPKAVSHSINECVFYPNLKHSKKPDIIRDMIVELVGDVPRVELFARNTTPGWDVFGNEVESSISLS